MNDEGRPIERPTANIAAENVPRDDARLRRPRSAVAAPLLPEERQTPLQKSLRALHRTLTDAHKMDERSRITFAAVGARTFANRFAPELLIAEADEITRRAA
jgi:hypothetical protein